MAIILGFIPLIMIGVVNILPYASAIGASMTGKASLSGEPSYVQLSELFSDPLIQRLIVFTSLQALASVALALIIGLPGAWWYSEPASILASGLRSLSALPFVLPPILVTLGFVLFYGNSGWLNRLLSYVMNTTEPPLRILYQPSAIILAHAFYNFPIVVRIVGDAFIRTKTNYQAAATALGASDFGFFWTIALPLSLPAIVSAALLVFLYCFTSFAMVLVLGGGPATSTMAVEIYRAARITLNFKRAGGLALIETCIALLACLAYGALQSPFNVTAFDEGQAPVSLKQLKRPHHRRLSWLFRFLYAVCLLFLVGGPLLSILFESFLIRVGSKLQLSLRWWTTIIGEAGPALVRSIITAIIAASLSCFLAIIAVISPAISAKTNQTSAKTVNKFFANIKSLIFTFPMASSGIVLGFGFLRLYGSWFSRSWMAVCLIHAVSAFPFVFRSIKLGFDSFSAQLSDASISLGANPAKTSVFVVVPVLTPRIRSAWAFAAAISLGELNAVIMLGLDNWETLPLLVYRCAGSYRFGAACVAGIFLLVACFLCFRLADLTINHKGTNYGLRAQARL